MIFSKFGQSFLSPQVKKARLLLITMVFASWDIRKFGNIGKVPKLHIMIT